MTRDPKQIDRDAKLAALADKIIAGERKAPSRTPWPGLA